MELTFNLKIDIDSKFIKEVLDKIDCNYKCDTCCFNLSSENSDSKICQLDKIYDFILEKTGKTSEQLELDESESELEKVKGIFL